jgi:hypothetical protein
MARHLPLDYEGQILSGGDRGGSDMKKIAKNADRPVSDIVKADQAVARLEEVANQLKEMADYLAYLATQPLNVITQTPPLR